MVAKHLGSKTVWGAEGRDGDKCIITRINHVRPALYIVNIYGENENRVGKMNILESWL